MAKEIWEEIQRAEAEANRILEEAKRHSSDLLRSAREKAGELVKKAEEEAIASGEELLNKIAQKNAQWKKEQSARVENEVQALIGLGERKKTGAVNMIIEKVVS